MYILTYKWPASQAGRAAGRPGSEPAMFLGVCMFVRSICLTPRLRINSPANYTASWLSVCKKWSCYSSGCRTYICVLYRMHVSMSVCADVCPGINLVTLFPARFACICSMESTPTSNCLKSGPFSRQVTSRCGSIGPPSSSLLLHLHACIYQHTYSWGMFTHACI